MITARLNAVPYATDKSSVELHRTVLCLKISRVYKGPSLTLESFYWRLLQKFQHATLVCAHLFPNKLP